MSAPTEPMTTDEAIIASIGSYGYGWHDSDAAGMSAQLPSVLDMCPSGRVLCPSPGAAGP